MSTIDREKTIDAFIMRTRAMTGQVVRERAPWNQIATADAIRHFSYGIGDDNPLWLDPQYASKSPYGQLAAPPTFLISVLYPMLHGAPLDVPMHSLVIELEYCWYHSILVGDRLRAFARLKKVFEAKSQRRHRSVYIISETEYWNQRNELVARATGTLMRLSYNRGEMFTDRPVYRYEQEELAEISAALDRESRTGDRQFYAEDVAVGDELPGLTRGPLTIGDMICWHAAVGPPYRAGPLAYRDGLKAPHTIVNNPATGWGVKYSQQHEDFHLASQRGMPAPFDNGVMRFAWISPLLTNWMGDAGILKKLSLQIVAPNLYGDTTSYRGIVIDKTALEEGVDVGIELTGTNQLDTITTMGTATVTLPVGNVHQGHDLQKAKKSASIRISNIKRACIHDLVDQQASKRPGEIALIFHNQKITYEELNRHTGRLADHLRFLGVKPDTLVGLCLERSLELVVSLLAILKAGGAFVPLDPEYPQERLAFMFEDADLRFVLTKEDLRHRLPRLSAEIICIDMDEKFLAADDAANRSLKIDEDRMAYVMYTSGTTNLPKGVVVSHSSLSTYIQSIAGALPVNENDVYLQTASISFSAAVRQIMLPLYKGGQIILADWEETRNALALLELIKRCRVTVWDTIPSIWNSCATALKQLDRQSINRLLTNDLRLVLLTGEPLHWEVVRTWRDDLGHRADIYNLYSQTETTGTVCRFKVPQEIDTMTGIVPLGRPIDNTAIYILDETLQPVPDGDEGELCVSGPRLAEGYLGKPLPTSKRFVPNAFDNRTGPQLYRTRDLGRRLPDGTFEYLGRLDDQIKIRGFRIAPTEVEGAFANHVKVKEVAIASTEGFSGDKKLVAYVVPKEHFAYTINGRLRYRLPNNMAVIHLNRHETDFSYHAIFETQTYLKYGITVNDGDCVFDLGANIGLFALFINSHCRNPSVYCFEPNPHVFDILRANTRLYAPATKLFPFGLSDRGKTANFTFFSGSSLQSGLYADPDKEKEVARQVIINQRDAGIAYMDEIAEASDYILDHRFSSDTIEVQLKTISDMISKIGIETINLLKINVEKSELDILRGVKDADWGKIEQLVIKVDVQENLNPILAMLHSHGYETIVGQDRLLKGTSINTVYAIRPSADKQLQTTKGANQYSQDSPIVSEPFITPDELIEHLKVKLPQYMVPSKFIFVDRLPRTPSGKIDRQNLPSLDKSGRQEHKIKEKPDLEIEKALSHIWQKILDVEQVGIKDNFFELGGDSLQVATLLAAVRQKFNVQISFRTFFEQPTIDGMVAFIKKTQMEESDQTRSNQDKKLRNTLKKLEEDF